MTVLEKLQEAWNFAGPYSYKVPGYNSGKIWFARAWPWHNHRPCCGVGFNREEAINNLREMIAEVCGGEEK